MSYYHSRRKKLSFFNKLLVFISFIICLWAAGLAIQYLYQDELGEYSIYNIDKVNENIAAFYPIPTKVEKVYIDKDFKKKSNDVYVIKLITGGEIIANNIMITENTVSYKDAKGISVSIERDQVETVSKKKM